MKVAIKEQEEVEKQLAEARDAAIPAIGNLVHDSVPISDDEVGVHKACAACTPGVLWVVGKELWWAGGKGVCTVVHKG